MEKFNGTLSSYKGRVFESTKAQEEEAVSGRPYIHDADCQIGSADRNFYQGINLFMVLCIHPDKRRLAGIPK